MSNRVTIEPTIFTNVRSGEVTKGIRIYDDNAQEYDNTWDSIPDDDIEVLKKVILEHSCTERISDMLIFVQEYKSGIYIGCEWYEWEQIKDCFVEVRDEFADLCESLDTLNTGD